MKIELKFSILSDFSDDIMVEFESFYYFNFGIILEAFPNSPLPLCFGVDNTLTTDISRRELFKSLSSYTHSAETLRRMIKKNYIDL